MKAHRVRPTTIVRILGTLAVALVPLSLAAQTATSRAPVDVDPTTGRVGPFTVTATPCSTSTDGTLIHGDYITSSDTCGAITSVSINVNSLVAGVRIRGHVYPSTTTAAELVRALQPCSAAEHRIGATVTVCHPAADFNVSVIEGGPARLVSLMIEPARPSSSIAPPSRGRPR